MFGFITHIFLLKVPQELTDSITISITHSNYSPSSKAHVLSSHNYFVSLYELLQDKVHYNIAQDTQASLGRDKTQSGLLCMKGEADSSITQ